MSLKLICTNCGREMRPKKIGVRVLELIEMDQVTEDREPYKIWSADLMECPQCKMTIVSRFGNTPLTEHFQPGFQLVLENVRKLSEDEYFEFI